MKILLFIMLFIQDGKTTNYDTINITKFISYDTTDIQLPKYRFSITINKIDKKRIKKKVTSYKYCYLIMDSFIPTRELEFVYRMILTGDIKKRFKIKILNNFGPNKSKCRPKTIQVYLYLTNSKINSFNEAQINFGFSP